MLAVAGSDSLMSQDAVAPVHLYRKDQRKSGEGGRRENRQRVVRRLGGNVKIERLGILNYVASRDGKLVTPLIEISSTDGARQESLGDPEPQPERLRADVAPLSVHMMNWAEADPVLQEIAPKLFGGCPEGSVKDMVSISCLPRASGREAAVAVS